MGRSVLAFALATGLSALALTASVLAATPEVSGRVGYEVRLFAHQPLYAQQSGRSNQSLFVEPEFYWEWQGGDDSLLFKPYLRADQHDGRRSHADIRELLWTHVGEAWELKVGIGRVFWGVTEFQHLVDVVNQTDGVEDIDGEDKLGQPMLKLALIRDWGVLDLMLLPGFRERTFVGAEGRLRGPGVIDTHRPHYESAAQQQHIDGVVRWSHTLGDYDVGLYWFHGTNRQPALYNEAGLWRPFYQQMDQIGLDLQATLGDWLWKLELLRRDTRAEHFTALQGGFEYTLVGIADSDADLGLLMEYGWDERGADSQTGVQNDLFIGLRLTLNDVQSSELLAGIGQDLDHSRYSLLLEASRRLGNSWKLSADARVFHSSDNADGMYAIRDDDLLQLTLARYF